MSLPYVVRTEAALYEYRTRRCKGSGVLTVGRITQSAGLFLVVLGIV